MGFKLVNDAIPRTVGCEATSSFDPTHRRSPFDVSRIPETWKS